jgi:hypothetical protein
MRRAIVALAASGAGEQRGASTIGPHLGFPER